MSEIDDIISIAVGEMEDDIVTIEFKYRWVVNRRGTAATRFYGEDSGFAVLQEYLSKYSVVTFDVGGKTYGMTWVADLIGSQTTGSIQTATAEGETQTALLVAPPAPSIVVDKAQVENDDHLKSVIKKYFNKQRFRINRFGIVQDIVIADIEDLSVTSVSGTMFIADIKYRYTIPDYGSFSHIEYATSKIEKTADSYKIISFDRKR